ncbi:hypothetical protein RQP50_05590 [Paenibacillus sp. chi10]|uniref:Uncharacterized protein n=1 Tax=Paenibacillus suaedae TaxID=3077233 RepID=A0AAJ2JWV7_9BACL|nr:hypothetical protein [Paenibacillus sp. chi10]MDT8975712.1 hypothetical protein [Paenibacillus sp. chi10]
MQLENFAEILKVIFPRSEVKHDTDKIIFEYRGLEIKIDQIQISELSDRLSILEHRESTLLYSDNYYETLVSFEGRRIMSRFENNFDVEDTQNNINYLIGKASDEYILFLLQVLHTNDLLREFTRRTFYPSHMLQERFERSGSTNVFDFLRIGLRNLYTLKITTRDSKSYAEFERYNNSFLFHLAYNFDASIVEIKLLEDFLNSQRLERIRRNTDEVDPPRRRYIPELVYHYQMAVASESPYLQFISYYHVIEHFFEKIYNEELVKVVQDTVSSPSFSLKRENDIKKVIRVINNKLRARHEEYSINEREALELTLIKYIDSNSLKEKLKEYDDSLLDFYHDNEVVFSGGATINFDSPQEKEILKKISSRIYSTRNSIVHSKENDKLKYTPFKHDRYLIKEIPLVRFIAEEIILSNSKLL